MQETIAASIGAIEAPSLCIGNSQTRIFSSSKVRTENTLKRAVGGNAMYKKNQTVFRTRNVTSGNDYLQYYDFYGDEGTASRPADGWNRPSVRTPLLPRSVRSTSVPSKQNTGVVSTADAVKLNARESKAWRFMHIF